MGPMPWTINAEIYPQWARSTGNGLATAVNWVFNLAISMSFLSLMTLITRQGWWWSSFAYVSKRLGPIFVLLPYPMVDVELDFFEA